LGRVQPGGHPAALVAGTGGLVDYGGVINLYWIVGLAVLVLVDKLLPSGHRAGDIRGVGFLVWGAWLLI